MTDHIPLIWLHSLKDPISRLNRWRLKLAEYDYAIVYKAGKTNVNADALSRNPVTMNRLATSQLALDKIINLKSKPETFLEPDHMLTHGKDNVPFTQEELGQPVVHVITRAQVHRSPENVNPTPASSSDSQPIATRLRRRDIPKRHTKLKPTDPPEETQPTSHKLRSRLRSAIAIPPKEPTIRERA